MLRPPFPVIVGLANSPVKSVEPEVIVGGLVRLGEALKPSAMP